jgi:C4-dicarboxylate transporter DctM subunit
LVGRPAPQPGGREAFLGIDAFALTAVPLFILTGDVLVRTGLSRKFLDVAEALTCWAKGGFGSATVLVCGMFAAISGSDAAGAAAVGRMTIDRLVESGYPRPYACALVAAGACTGILIPPSIAYIIIGLVLGIAVSTLFLAAVIPGLADPRLDPRHQHRDEPPQPLGRRRDHDDAANGGRTCGGR